MGSRQELCPPSTCFASTPMLARLRNDGRLGEPAPPAFRPMPAAGDGRHHKESILLSLVLTMPKPGPPAPSGPGWPAAGRPCNGPAPPPPPCPRAAARADRGAARLRGAGCRPGAAGPRSDCTPHLTERAGICTSHATIQVAADGPQRERLTGICPSLACMCEARARAARVCACVCACARVCVDTSRQWVHEACDPCCHRLVAGAHAGN